MEQNEHRPDAVPYIVFEGEMARHERYVRRMWIALIIAVLCIALVTGIFVWYLNQYDFCSYEQDGEGVNIIGDRNGVGFNAGYDVPEGQAENQEEPQFNLWPRD